MSRPAPKSSRPLVPNPSEIAITNGPSLPAPSPPTVPSISCSEDRHYFYLKDVDSVVFSATQTVCPFSSEVKPDFKHEDPDPEEIFQLRFILSRYIQVAATPDDSELKYSGPLFQRLSTIQIVPSGAYYALSPEQKSSWQWLEDTLYHVASTFSTDSLLPMEFSMLALPSSYGYLRNHKKQSYALRCAKRSRLAFHSLIGLVNLFYGRALVRYESAKSTDTKPTLSPSRTLILSGLCEAHVCDIIDALKPEILGRCVGVVLEPGSSAWGPMLPYLNRIRVPVWIKIGTSKGIFYTNSFKHPNFNVATPKNEEELRIRAMIHKSMAEDIRPSPSNPTPDSLHQWNTLLQARKSKLEEFISRASDSIKERVQKRLQAASNFVLPTQRDGTRFFMWYRSNKGRFRGELDYEDAKKEFEGRRREHFVYDEISNQWDICSLFDEDHGATQDEDTFDNHPLQDDTIPTPQLNQPPTLAPDHNELGRTMVHQGPIGQDMVFGTSLEDVLYSRYGLLCSTQSEIQSAADYTPIEESRIVDTYTVRKYIMEVNLHLERHSNEFAIRYFVSSLVLEIQPPSLLWDLYPDNARQLLTHNVYFKIDLVKDHTLSGYLFLPLVPKYARKWNLFVYNATTVAQCIREQWGPSLEDVILCLFERGIPFKLLFNVAYPIIPRPITVFESNRRPFGWQADKYEYMEYELRRNRLLRLPHIRVAVAQAGGILWRLCKQELANDIPSGPSPDVLYFADTSPQVSRTYLFDTLSEHEIEILCGIYYVDTDRRAQTTTLAWWPAPQLWDSAGLDTGYWTLSCEQLFQARLERIRTGNATLLTTKKWRSDLKYYKNQSRKIHARIEKECQLLFE